MKMGKFQCAERAQEANLQEEDNIVRIPLHMINQIKKLMQATEQLQQTLGRQPADEEVAESMNWPLKRLNGVKKLERELGDKLGEGWLSGVQEEDNPL